MSNVSFANVIIGMTSCETEKGLASRTLEKLCMYIFSFDVRIKQNICFATSRSNQRTNTLLYFDMNAQTLTFPRICSDKKVPRRRSVSGSNYGLETGDRDNRVHLVISEKYDNVFAFRAAFRGTRKGRRNKRRTMRERRLDRWHACKLDI
jgi:hypothetical protein